MCSCTKYRQQCFVEESQQNDISPTRALAIEVSKAFNQCLRPFSHPGYMLLDEWNGLLQQIQYSGLQKKGNNTLCREVNRMTGAGLKSKPWKRLMP